MQTQRLLHVSAKHFKNLEIDDNFQLSPLNIFIGPNGSGKSNLIGLLHFLQKASTDSIDRNRGITNFEEAMIELGGGHILDRSLTAPFTIPTRFHFESTKKERIDQFDLDLLVQSESRGTIIQKESLANTANTAASIPPEWDKPFYYYQSHNQGSGGGVISVYDKTKRGTKVKGSYFHKLSDIPVNELTLVAAPRLLENSAIPPEQAPIYEIRRTLIDSISQWRFYNANVMNLNTIRQSEPKIGPPDKYLSETGENLPLVMSNLSRDSIDFEESILNAFKLILPHTRRIRAVTSGRLSLTIEWYVDGITERFYLNEMSDGTVRMLCWATILLSPELPSLLVLDEPEMGLHIAWMPILADWIKQAAKRTQVIISTHSPDLLDCFSDCLDSVYRFSLINNSPKRFRPERLPSASIQPWFDEGWKLGDLYRVGNPSVGGWPW